MLEGPEAKKLESVNLDKLKSVLDFADDKHQQEGDMKASTAYRLVQILYFDKFSDGETLYKLGKLAEDMKMLDSPIKRRAESTITELEKKGDEISLGEKSILLKSDEKPTITEESARKDTD